MVLMKDVQCGGRGKGGEDGRRLGDWVSRGERWLGFSLQRFGPDRGLLCRLIGTSCWRRGLVQGGISPTGAEPRRR